MGMKKQSSITRWICIALVLCLISAAGASFIQTQGGKIDITDAKIPMANGETLSVLVYRPRTATPENPAPCVVTSHGYFNSKEMQDSTSIELARRGFVVYSMDIYDHGFSSGTRETYLYNREFYALGMLDLVDYIHDKITYVDPERIGITGHSTGGRMVSYALDAYGRNERIEKGIAEGAHYSTEPANAGKYETKISSALIVANFPAAYLLENIPSGVNVGINLAYYDEGAPMQLTKLDNYFWGDLTVSPEAKNFINLSVPNTFQLDKSIDYQTETGKPDIKFSNWDMGETVEMGKFYGSIENGTSRVLYNPREIHPLNHFSTVSAGIMTDYFTQTLGAPNPLPAGNQQWLLKELLNGLGLIGFFIFVLQMAFALLETPLFASLKGTAPKKLPALKTGKSKGFFWGGLALGALVSAATVMPLMQANTKVFTDSSMQNTTSWFCQPSTNQIMLWAVGNGIFAIVFFAVMYYVNGKKSGVTPDQWGIQIAGKQFLKTVLLAATVVFCAYALVETVDMMFKTDFRIWTFAVKAIDRSKIIVMLKYVPFFFIYYFANSLVINGSYRVEGQKEGRNLLYCILGNIVGPIAVIFIQYAVLISRGEALWHPNLSWINILLLIPFVPILSIAAVYSRKLFNKTGNIWLASFVNAVLITLITVANTTTISTLI